MLDAGAVQLKQAAETAQPADAVLGHCARDILFHQTDGFIPGRNVNAGRGVAFGIALFHGSSTPFYSFLLVLDWLSGRSKI